MSPKYLFNPSSFRIICLSISVYSGQTRVLGKSSYQQKIATFNLKKGEKSPQVYLPTFDYCLGSLEVKLDDVKSPDTTARLTINADEVEVAKGERFLENKCTIIDLKKYGINQLVKIKCSEDGGSNFAGSTKSKTFTLKIIPKINLSIDNSLKEYEVGDRLYENEDGTKTVYLSYAYTKGDTTNQESLSVHFVAIPKQPLSKNKLTDEEISEFKGFVERYRKDRVDEEGFWDNSLNLFKTLGHYPELFGRWSISGESFDDLDYGESKKIKGKNVKVLGFSGPSDVNLVESNIDYENAINDFNTLIESFSDEKETDVSPAYGERALIEKINLAGAIGQKKTMLELCDEFKKRYPEPSISLPSECNNQLQLSNSEISTEFVLINNEVKEISFKGIYEPSFNEYNAEFLIDYPEGTSKTANIGKNDAFYLEGGISQLTGGISQFSSIVNNAREELFKWNNVKECDSTGKKYLKDYWEAVGLGTNKWDCKNDPWSGVFISYIMKQAGVNFPYSIGAKHKEYFSKIRDNPKDYDCKTNIIDNIENIKEGDILCKCRGQTCQGFGYDNPPEAGHCDIVIEVN
ncbi:MAG: hypothetical protein G01um101493_360 [Microgenomates group bacterium Gr01-1014_93]|nr:MAG: hypothetical protein G01um101493_360 [Microgenomates group bacterium Gr01-1014_93]